MKKFGCVMMACPNFSIDRKELFIKKPIVLMEKF